MRPGDVPVGSVGSATTTRVYNLTCITTNRKTKRKPLPDLMAKGTHKHMLA